MVKTFGFRRLSLQPTGSRPSGLTGGDQSSTGIYIRVAEESARNLKKTHISGPFPRVKDADSILRYWAYHIAFMRKLI